MTNPEHVPSPSSDPAPDDLPASARGDGGMPPEGPADETEEPPSGGSWLRVLVFSLLLAGVGTVALVGYLYTRFLDPEAMRRQFEIQVGQAVGLPVKVGEIRLDFPTVSLADVEIGSAAVSADQPRVVAANVTVTPDFWELLSGRIQFESLVLASAGIDLVRGADGAFQLGQSSSETAQPAPPGAASSFDIPFRSITLQEIVVRIDDRGKGRLLTARLENAELGGFAAGRDRQLSFALRLDEQVQVAFSGLLLAAPGIDGKLNIDGLDRAKLQPWLPEGVTLPPELGQPSIRSNIRFVQGGELELSKLAISGKDGLDVTGAVRFARLSPPDGTITLDLQPLATGRLFELARPFVPPSVKGLRLEKGQLGGGVELTLKDGAVSAWKGHARPKGVHLQLAALPVPVDGLEGALTFDAGNLRWENLSAKVPGISARSEKGRLSLSDLRGEAQVILHLETAEALTGMKKLLPTTVAGYDPSGKLDFSGTLLIDGEASRVSGKLDSRKVRFRPVPGKIPVEIERGSLEFKDVGAKQGRIAISELSARVLEMPLEVRGELNNGPDPSFKLSGKATVDLKTAFEALPLEIHDLRREARVGGKVALTARLEGSVKKPVFDATADLSAGSVTLLKSGFTVSDLMGKVLADQKGMTVRGVRGAVAGGRLQLDGQIQDFANPQILASGSLNGVDLGKVRDLLGKLLPSFPSELAFNGNADLDLAISGSGGQPKLRGAAVLTGASLQHPSLMRPLRSIVGPIRFDNQTISTEGLKAAWGSSTVQVVGRVSDLAKFRLEFDYSVQPLDLTDIGGFFLAGTGYRIEGMGNGAGKVTGPIEKMVLDGTAQIPVGSFEAPISKSGEGTFKFPFTDLKAPFRLSDGVLDLTKVRCNLYKGTLESSGKIFVKEQPIRFDFTTTGSNLAVQEFLAANTRFKDALAGNLSLNAKTTGNTTGLVSLDGGMDVLMKNGSYKAPPAAAQVFSMLEAGQLSAGKLETFQGKMVVKGGQIITDDLGVKTPQGQVGWRGSMGLDTSLKGTLDLKLTNETCQTSPVLKQLVGRRPMLELPVGIKGSLLSPAIDLNVQDLLEKAAGQALEDVARREAENLLGGLLGGKKKKEPAPVTAPAPAPSVVIASPPVAIPVPTPTPAPIPATSTAVATAPAPVEPPKPQSPEKQLKQEMKKLEKDLKKIFKF